MAKVIEYNVEGVEESGGGTGLKARPAVYVAKIMKESHYTQKRDGTPANAIEVALAVGEEYDWVFTYVGLDDASDWKLAEYIRALNLKDKGKLTIGKQVGKLIRVKLNPGEWNGAYSPEAGRLMKAQPGDEYGSPVSELAAAAADETNDSAEADSQPNADGVKEYSNPEFVPSREGEEGIGTYDEWEDADLEAEVADRDLTIPGGRGSKRDKLIKALRDEDAEIAGGDGEEPAAAGEAAADVPDDYEDWETDRLKEEWGQRELGDVPSVRGSNAEARLRTALIEAIRKDDAENPFS